MKGSQDKEFKDLANRVVIGVFVFLIFAVLLIVIFIRKFSFMDPLNKKMKEKEDFVIYISGENCDRCDVIKSCLDNNGVNYTEIVENSDEANKIFKKYNFNTKESIIPAVLYFEDGSLKANLVNINVTDELELFLNNYKLSSK